MFANKIKRFLFDFQTKYQLYFVLYLNFHIRIDDDEIIKIIICDVCVKKIRFMFQIEKYFDVFISLFQRFRQFFFFVQIEHQF